MTELEIKTQIIGALNRLTVAQQEKLLDVIQSITAPKHKPKEPCMVQLAGAIDKTDLALMEKSIAEACENIHPDDWQPDA